MQVLARSPRWASSSVAVIMCFVINPCGLLTCGVNQMIWRRSPSGSERRVHCAESSGGWTLPSSGRKYQTRQTCNCVSKCWDVLIWTFDSLSYKKRLTDWHSFPFCILIYVCRQIISIDDFGSVHLRSNVTLPSSSTLTADWCLCRVSVGDIFHTSS